MVKSTKSTRRRGRRYRSRLAEPPEDWTELVYGIERGDLGYSEPDMRGTDQAEPSP
jgi:hypothetical protein